MENGSTQAVTLQLETANSGAGGRHDPLIPLLKDVSAPNDTEVLRTRVEIDQNILEHFRAGYANSTITTFGMKLKTSQVVVYGVLLEEKKILAVADEFGMWLEEDFKPFIGVLEHGFFVAKLSERPDTRVLQYEPFGGEL